MVRLRSQLLFSTHICVMSCVTALLVAPSTIQAQPDTIPGIHQPLNQTVPPGTAAHFALVRGVLQAGCQQPIRVDLPKSQGTVGFYDHATGGFAFHAAPGQVSVEVGHVHRLQISDLPGRPDDVLYPTIEVIDRLHPPAGREHEFPILISITQSDIQQVLENKLVTKVVYLEQPQLASHLDVQHPESTFTLPHKINLLAEADKRGRPMVIVRIGNRQPPVHGQIDDFFGTGGRITESSPVERAETPSPLPRPLKFPGSTTTDPAETQPNVHPDIEPNPYDPIPMPGPMDGADPDRDGAVPVANGGSTAFHSSARPLRLLRSDRTAPVRNGDGDLFRDSRLDYPRGRD